MLDVQPFRPYPSGTVSVTATSANGTASLGTASLPGFIALRIHNNSTGVTAFVEFGGAATVAATTTASMPVPPGAIEVVNVDQSSFVAAITSSGTATVYFTKGYGL